MTMHYADGTMVTTPAFANHPTFHPQWEQLQRELGIVLYEANSSNPVHPVTGRHAYFGACRAAITTLTALVNLEQTPPSKS